MNRLNSVSDRLNPTSEDLKIEIEKRLGYFPPFYTLVLSNPRLLKTLWNQLRNGYLDNPLPDMLKEKLQARLARYCTVPHAIVIHTTALRESGLKASDILEVLEIHSPDSEQDLEQHVQHLQSTTVSISNWPAPNSPQEMSLLAIAIFMFLKPGQSTRTQDTVSRFLGSDLYGNFLAFLACVKSYHHWIEAYPGTPIELVPRVWDRFILLLQEEPRLARVFRDYVESIQAKKDLFDTYQRTPKELESKYEKAASDLTKAIEFLKKEIAKGKRIERDLLVSQQQFNELFEAISDIVINYDLEGNLIALNLAAEHILGYARADALQMNISQIVASENAGSLSRMLDTKTCAEKPLKYELAVVAKDNRKELLEVTQKIIYSDQKHAEFQIIARPVHRQTSIQQTSPKEIIETPAPSQSNSGKPAKEETEIAENELQAQIIKQKSIEETLRAALEKSEAQRADLIKVCQDLESTVADQKSEEEKLRQSLAEAESKLAEIRGIRETAEKEIDAHRISEEELQHAYADAKARIDEIERANETLKNNIDKEQSEKLALQNALAELEARFANLGKNHEDAQAQIRQHQDETASLRDALAAAQEKLSQVSTSAESLEKEVLRHQDERQALQNALAEVESRSLEAVEKHKALESQIAQHEKEKAELEHALSKAESQADEVLGNHKAALEEVGALQNAFANMESRLSDILTIQEAQSAEYESEKKHLQDALAAAEEKLSQVSLSSESLEKEILRLQDEKQALQNALSELEARFAELGKNHEDAHAQIRQHQDETASLRSALAAAEEKLSQASLGSESLEKEILRLQDEKQALQVRFAESEQSLENLKRYASDSKTGLDEQIRELLEANESLENEIRERKRAEEELKRSFAESEARSATLQRSCEQLQERITEHQQETESLRRAFSEMKDQHREETHKLVQQNEALRNQIEAHKKTEEQMLKSISEAEARSAEMQRLLESGQGIAVRHEDSETTLQQTLAECQAFKTVLEKHSSLFAILGEMCSMLRVCSSVDEAVAVIAQHIEQFFPNHSGLLYIMNHNQNLVESVFGWGSHESSKPSFVPDECFALRRNCVHASRNPRSGLLCKHIRSPIPSAFVCVPMIARREVLGVLHLIDHTGECSSESDQQLATTVTEYIAMALLNIQCDRS